MAARQSIGEDKERILQVKQDDIERLMDIDEVLNEFLKIGHIDQHEFSQILSSSRLKDKVQSFISHLCILGPRAYESFISLLKNSDKQNHQNLADLLENPDPRKPVANVPQPDDFLAKRTAQGRREREVDSTLHDHEKRIHTLEGIEQSRARAEVEDLRKVILETEQELKDTKERLEKQENVSNSLTEENEKLRKRVQTLERELRETRDMWEAKSKALEERIDNQERVNEDYRGKVDQLVKQMEALQKPPRQSAIQPQHRFQSRTPATAAWRSNRQVNQQATGRGKDGASKK